MNRGETFAAVRRRNSLPSLSLAAMAYPLAAAPTLDDRTALKIGTADPKLLALQRAQARRDEIGSELALAYEAAIWDAVQHRDLDDPTVLADIDRAAQAADAVLLRIDIPRILAVRLPAIRKDWWNAPLYRDRREPVGTGPYAKRAGRAFDPDKGVRGHHVTSQRAWRDVVGYFADDDFALSPKFMERHGIKHLEKVTPAQNREYRKLVKEGISPSGWREVKIAQIILIEGGATKELARLLVILSLRNKRRQGLSSLKGLKGWDLKISTNRRGEGK